MSNRRNTRILTVLFVFICLFLNGDDTLKQLAEAKNVSADFVQIRKIRNLKKPLRITGHFCWEKTGRFVWTVKTPIRYTCILTDENLLQWDGDSGKITRLKIKDHPAAAAVFKSMQKLIDPEGSGLFTVSHTTNSEIRLVPVKESEFSTFLVNLTLTVSADRNYVTNVRIEEISGDVTELSFSHVAINQELPPETWSLPR